MTANAGKGANGRSIEADGEEGQPKQIEAAKPAEDDATGSTSDTADASDASDTSENGSAPSGRTEDTVVDLAVKKPSGEETVHDIKLPEKKKLAGDPTGDAAGSTDRLVSRGASSDGAGTNKTPKSGESWSGSGSRTAMDIPARESGFGGSDSAPGTSSSYASGRRTAIEPAPRPVTDPAKPVTRKPPRKAHLQVARFEPWSVMKFSFIMSLVCFLVLFVAVVVLYLILSGLGVFDALSDTIRDLQGKSSSGLNPASWFSAARVLGYTALIGILNVLLITALATVWSVIYNMAADLVGGVEVTLKEADQ